MDYFLHIAVLWCIYGVLASSLNLLVGHAGLLSLAHAAFYGIGAYTSSILTVRCNIPFVVAWPAGIVVAALLSTAVSFPSLRVRDDYFVIATFAFQLISFSVFENWTKVTGGALGIAGIPRPSILGWNLQSQIDWAIFAFAVCAFTLMLTFKIISSPYGRVLRAIREDELFVQALGKNVLYFKVSVFAVSAALAACAGVLYAHFISYIDHTSFSILESALVLSMVIIGGAGGFLGPLLGAVLLVSLPELLRFVGLPGSAAANLRQIIYGILLVIMVMYRPRGIVGRYGFGR